MEKYSLIDRCPITGSDSSTVYFDLGNFPLVNNLHDTKEESINCERFPLRINHFDVSGLSALSHAVDGDLLFKHYLYKSEVNTPYIAHCKNMFEDINSYLGLKSGDLIIDIGGNDGSLLNAFREQNTELRFLNIDPSVNLSETCKAKNIPVIVDYFSSELAKTLEKPKVIVSTNVFQHLKDIDGFVRGVSHLLSDDSMWVLEFPYWNHDIDTMQFDQVYHEHMYYYSVTPLTKLFANHGLRVVKVEPQKIHGGTLRLYIAKEGSYIPDASINEFLAKEHKYDISYLLDWGSKVHKQLETYRNTILEYKKDGKKIACFGAAAKGCIFLNALGLTDKEIEFIIDDTDIKQGKYMPGTGLQILDRSILKTVDIDVIIILTHNFAEFIAKKLRNDNFAGEIITIIPTVTRF